MIFDPTQTGFGKKERNFYYQKTGDQYYLLSVGADGKPFTKDDNLPDLTAQEKAKAGWIATQQ
jgi:hypothetical protein